ncbi:RIO1 family regulatory kinase/ATPase domain-containing protein [Halolamina salifodinae]|uniref:non-specific serine/threonine protein kinase n=1 Tax=Halolamina salifodinae TaxID=1202767 RepID=A0A8T4GVF4_9EURY|nr:RIO1 family regulatory kinase/ATPase [Halolamina salifodinae]MBP1986886.1 tRNA A-37 threonylcarbamoyl transferase component Bud32 [Halolamina salifodinae]
MELRKLVRGRPEWSRIESVVRELGERYDRESVHVEFLDADNWLSTPLVLDDEYFVKLVTEQNSLVHALFTATRNLGAFSSGTEGFFGHYGTPYQMAQHELEATEHLREVGVNAPEPIEALEIEGMGVLVMEYLPEFDALDDVDEATERRLAPAVFEALRTMHDHGLAHGDLRAENVLIVKDEIFVIDATNVRDDEGDGATMAAARAYDLACALAALEPLIGAKAAVAAALDHYDETQLLEAREFLDFVSVRPDHTFAAAELKGEIEKRAGQAGREQ